MGARGDGSSIAAHDAALVGRVELYDLPPGLIVGGGGYTGGASHGVAALSGLRVAIAEADLRYHNHGFDLRAEYARLWIVDSYLANDYFGLLGQSAIPSRGRGFYWRRATTCCGWRRSARRRSWCCSAATRTSIRAARCRLTTSTRRRSPGRENAARRRRPPRPSSAAGSTTGPFRLWRSSSTSRSRWTACGRRKRRPRCRRTPRRRLVHRQ